MSTAAKPQERRVEVVAGLDATQLEAAWLLHKAFAEEKGLDMDEAVWIEEVKLLVAHGCFNVVVAWDGDKPVGVAEMHLEYDPFTRVLTSWGKRAYVLPEYRNTHIFGTIFRLGLNAAEFMGVTVCRAVAETDWYGQAMKKFYESQGLKAIGTIMERA